MAPLTCGLEIEITGVRSTLTVSVLEMRGKKDTHLKIEIHVMYPSIKQVK